MASIYQRFNRLMITAVEYQETDQPLCVVCVCLKGSQHTVPVVPPLIYLQWLLTETSQ